MERPKIAIIEPNSLAILGLKQLLQTAMPIMSIEAFGSFAELEASKPERFFHYFAAMNIVLEHMSFFTEHRRKTIVLTLSLENGMPALSQFKCLVRQPARGWARQVTPRHGAAGTRQGTAPSPHA